MDCVFLPGWGSSKTFSKYFYLSFFQSLTCFNEIECLFFPDRGVKHSISELSRMAAIHLYNNNAEGNIHVIGYSMGGVVGMELIATHPYLAQTISTLTTIASPLHGTSGWHKIPAYFSRSATDMLNDSMFMDVFTNKHIPNTKNTKKLTISAQYDGLISQSSAHLQDAARVVSENATHLTVLQSHQTQDSVKKFVRTGLDVVPSLRFLKLDQKLSQK